MILEELVKERIIQRFKNRNEINGEFNSGLEETETQRMIKFFSVLLIPRKFYYESQISRKRFANKFLERALEYSEITSTLNKVYFEIVPIRKKNKTFARYNAGKRNRIMVIAYSLDYYFREE